ncbi:hypothetical protein ONB71_00080 [Candidatus Purcelliella pentastirinorum]|uniref:Uncharacterized protein n=1 Tax=Candidatus Purcelliella pentastirinorum TaxID=472834 RepID=A0AAX3N7Y5_9ENTR|nr:hypothetical protein [Candidatus Purcelliella pentastirinorum]WDI78544.1 hypothetical protein ONB71_00080 [Candidatus Purcelliella pentastirinorum]WDR80427.1 hypothetical protein ONB70_01840 [Candidatus Purcelliella pentastirinorum]
MFLLLFNNVTYNDIILDLSIIVFNDTNLSLFFLHFLNRSHSRVFIFNIFSLLFNNDPILPNPIITIFYF